MAKPWDIDFDPLIESFNRFPIWVQLLNLSMHLWRDSIFETINNAISDFLYIDSNTTDIFYLTHAQILVEMDVSKGLLENIFLESLRGS